MSEDLKRLRDAADLVRAIPEPDAHPALTGFFGAVGDWLESTASRAGYTVRGIDLEHAHRVADAIIAAQETPSPRTLVFADEGDAVHFAPQGRAECGAPAGGAPCLASVTCRDCLDAFHAPAAPRPFRVGDVVEITGRDGEDVTASCGAALNGRTGVVAEIDDNPEYPVGLQVEGYLGLVWCNSTEVRHADPAEVAR